MLNSQSPDSFAPSAHPIATLARRAVELGCPVRILYRSGLDEVTAFESPGVVSVEPNSLVCWVCQPALIRHRFSLDRVDDLQLCGEVS